MAAATAAVAAWVASSTAERAKAVTAGPGVAALALVAGLPGLAKGTAGGIRPPLLGPVGAAFVAAAGAELAAADGACLALAEVAGTSTGDAFNSAGALAALLEAACAA